MAELLLTFVGGLLGSSHCLGMCGGFALAVGQQVPGLRANLARQGAYTAGRVFTYAVLGAAAGYGGMRLVQGGYFGAAQCALAIVAGLSLIVLGLASAGAIPWRRWTAQAPCLAASLFAPFLRGKGVGSIFMAGVLTGLLPCGLVYAFAALAATSANQWHGALLMATFGLGTAPIMVFVGISGHWLSPAFRTWSFRVAGWCVVALGALTLLRAGGLLESGAACPLCYLRP